MTSTGRDWQGRAAGCGGWGADPTRKRRWKATHDFCQIDPVIVHTHTHTHTRARARRIKVELEQISEKKENSELTLMLIQ